MAEPAARGPGAANLIIGLPDDGRTRYTLVNPHTPPRLFAEGNIGFLPDVEDLWERRFPIWLGPSPEPFEVKLLPQAPLINSIADPDACSIALRKAAWLAEATGRPCFNHPAAVQATGRDAVARRLQGIPGLAAPGTIRLRPHGLAELTGAIAAAGLAYPVLVRIAGDHGGVSLLKIDAPDDFERGMSPGFLGRTLYVTEFRDFIDPDGLHRKYRVIVIGGEIVLQHAIVARGWHLHGADRSAATEPEEAKALAGFDAEMLPGIRATVAALAARIGLDYFGIDCHIAADGNLLLFEANACMDITGNPGDTSPNVWEAPIARIRAALRALLREPERWRGAPAASGAAAIASS